MHLNSAVTLSIDMRKEFRPFNWNLCAKRSTIYLIVYYSHI